MTKSDSEEDDDPVGNERLEDYLELKHLEKLHILFEKHRPPRDTSQDHLPKYKRVKIPERSHGFLTLDEFKSFIHKVVGRGEYENQLDKLFLKLDTSCDGYVDWSEFCTYILLYLKENDYLQGKRVVPFKSDPKIRHLVQNRQQPTSRILVTESPSKIVTTSKEGVIGVYDGTGHPEATYAMATEEMDAMGNKKRFHVWVMDACYMKNCHKVVISTSSRELKFFDFGSGVIKEFVHLFGLPNSVNCLDYYFDPKVANGESHLLCGDETGNLFHIKFINPTNTLFDLPNLQDQIQRVWYNEMGQHSRASSVDEHLDLHNEAILSVRYIPENECVISCSISPTASICIYDLHRRQTLYSFRQRRGALCFHLNREINVLATGSSDYHVRIWNPYVTNQPSAVMEGHHAPILSVVVHEKQGTIFSYSRDAVIKVWDIKDFICIQTVPVKVPSMDSGNLPEHMFCPMSFYRPGNQIILAAGDYMVIYKLGKPPTVFTKFPLTHKAPLCAAIYNKTFKQIVTGCDDSTITTWDLESGTKSLIFFKAHDNEEITSLSFDWSGRKLLSGARNGSVKVWNLQNGHNLQSLESEEEAEVTAVIALKDYHMYLTLGWNRKIVQYSTQTPDMYLLKPMSDWKGGMVHKEDILAVDYCDGLLATASYDGEIIVWTMETESILARLRKGLKEPIHRTMNRLQGLPLSRTSSTMTAASTGPTPLNSRPNSRHRKVHKAPPTGIPPPVDKLLFLSHRIEESRLNSAAVLVSSEAGTLRWWTLGDDNKNLGHFYGASGPDESILALTTNWNNSMLLSGDTRGYVTVWNIDKFHTKTQITSIDEMPPVLHQWQAHEKSLVSLDLASHETIGVLVITASSDCTARLFLLTGECIGIFGQKKIWNIEDPKTWRHFDKVEETKLNVPNDTNKSATGEENNDPVQEVDLSHTFVTKLPPTVPIPDETEEETQEEDKNNPNANQDPENIMENPNLESSIIQNSTEIPMPVQQEQLVKESDAFADFVLQRSKSLLGERADKDFERIQRGRQFRREHYADVNLSKPTRYGPKCSPFAALSTMDFQSMMVRSKLPVPAPRNVLNFQVYKNNEASFGVASGPHDLREVDPFLKNFEELKRTDHISGHISHDMGSKTPRRAPPAITSKR